MRNLSETQKLRSDLLERNSYDVKNAKACYDFVIGNENNTPIAADPMVDGIYLMLHTDEAILFTGQSLSDAEKSCVTGIGVKLGSKSLVVGMRDTIDGDTELTTETGGSRFITSYHDAVADWDGKANTEDIREILYKNAQVSDRQHIPSLGELYFILQHFNEINEALKAAGGDPVCNDWYWSSTQYSTAYAWFLSLGNGNARSRTKATYQGRVRPVSAFIA